MEGCTISDTSKSLYIEKDCMHRITTEGNNSVVILGEINNPAILIFYSYPPPPQSGRHKVKCRLVQILLNAGPGNGFVMISAT
jgi:hypothetical protein